MVLLKRFFSFIEFIFVLIELVLSSLKLFSEGLFIFLKFDMLMI